MHPGLFAVCMRPTFHFVELNIPLYFLHGIPLPFKCTNSKTFQQSYSVLLWPKCFAKLVGWFQLGPSPPASYEDCCLCWSQVSMSYFNDDAYPPRLGRTSLHTRTSNLQLACVRLLYEPHLDPHKRNRAPTRTGLCAHQLCSTKLSVNNYCSGSRGDQPPWWSRNKPGQLVPTHWLILNQSIRNFRKRTSDLVNQHIPWGVKGSVPRTETPQGYKFSTRNSWFLLVTNIKRQGHSIF